MGAYGSTSRPYERGMWRPIGRKMGRLLDEACWTTGHHRKTVTRRLGRREHAAGASRRPGTRLRVCPPRYGPAVVAALWQVWDAADCGCGKRLQLFFARTAGDAGAG